MIQIKLLRRPAMASLRENCYNYVFVIEKYVLWYQSNMTLLKDIYHYLEMNHLWVLSWRRINLIQMRIPVHSTPCWNQILLHLQIIFTIGLKVIRFSRMDNFRRRLLQSNLQHHFNVNNVPGSPPFCRRKMHVTKVTILQDINEWIQQFILTSL